MIGLGWYCVPLNSRVRSAMQHVTDASVPHAPGLNGTHS